jgi:hypothetical protein
VTILDSKPTAHYLARCAQCIRPVRGTSPRLSCPECGQQLTGDRLFAVTRDASCDGRCMTAVKASCACACGGENHGAAWSVGGLPTYTTEETETALRAYRARVAREEAERRKRQEAKARAARRAFDQWAEGCADIVEYLAAADYDSANMFILDMQRQADELKPLTERQEDAVRRCMDYDRRRAETAEKRAREAAQAQPVPTGKAITVEGEIVHTKSEEHYFGHGGMTDKMLIKGDDGWKVWTTIPAGLKSIGRPDPGGDFWGIKGKRVRFTADVTATEDDQTFGRAKRPRGAKFLPEKVAEDQP